MTKKILVVEDEEDILELLSEVLGDLGDYRVLFARDGEEALRITQADHPDIILLDIQLPRVNGNELCNSAESDPVFRALKY